MIRRFWMCLFFKLLWFIEIRGSKMLPRLHNSFAVTLLNSGSESAACVWPHVSKKNVRQGPRNIAWKYRLVWFKEFAEEVAGFGKEEAGSSCMSTVCLALCHWQSSFSAKQRILQWNLCLEIPKLNIHREEVSSLRLYTFFNLIKWML